MVVGGAPNIAVSGCQHRTDWAIGGNGVGVRTNRQQLKTAVGLAMDFAAQVMRILRGVLRWVQPVVCVLPKVDFCVGDWLAIDIDNSAVQPSSLARLAVG